MKNLIVNKGSGILPIQTYFRSPIWSHTAHNLVLIDVMRKEYQKEREKSVKDALEEYEEFRKNLNTIQLGGIWKGVKITDEDIKETRQDLLKKLEEKW